MLDVLKMKSFRHNDLDGVVSDLLFCKIYSILGYSHSSESGSSGPPIDKKILDFINSYEYSPETVIVITDVSMSYDVAKILDNLPNQIIHLDHHETSLKDLSVKDPDKNDFSWSYIKEGDSAAMICYRYLSKTFSDNPKVQDTLKSYQNLVALTDLWDTKPRDSENFIKYRENIDEMVTLLNTIGSSDFKARFMINPSVELTPEEFTKVQTVLRIKSNVMKYTNVFMRPHKRQGNSVLYGVCFGGLYRSEVAEYIFQNNSNLEFLFIIDMNNTKISLRRGNQSTLDLTKILHQIDPNGGGHPFACGGSFTLDNYKTFIDRILYGDFTLDWS